MKEVTLTEFCLAVEIQPLDASEQAKSIAIKTEQEAGPKFLKQKYAADQIRNVSICHHFFGWKHTISLLPVYRATYTYEGTEHLIYLSGVTGALQAVRPKVISNHSFSLLLFPHFFVSL